MLGHYIFLGGAIRALGLKTEVGRSVKDHYGATVLLNNEGRCDSACAYAFLGGIERDSNSIDRLGFHRFYNPIDFIDMKLDYAGLVRSMAMEDTQKISALLVMYIVEMGVDARMLSYFQSHGFDSVYTFDLNDGLNLRIVTNQRFGSWYLEPYGKSIVAASKKVGSSSPYDQVYQVTTYCRSKSGKRIPYILLSVPLQDYSQPDDVIKEGASLYYETSTERFVVPIAASQIRGWKDKSFMQIEIELGKGGEEVLTQEDKVGLALNTGRAQGLYFYDGQISKKEKEMIKASFLHCN
ncbi:MAG: hypothetical protein GX860_02340 [Alcaligenaceae bacterium]|nr:hypothetical protein [Alcaligenaceae bacterium]